MLPPSSRNWYLIYPYCNKLGRFVTSVLCKSSRVKEEKNSFMASLTGRPPALEQVGHAPHRQVPFAERRQAVDQPHPKLCPGLRLETRQRLGVPVRPAPHAASRGRRSERRGSGRVGPPHGLPGVNAINLFFSGTDKGAV